MVNEANGTLFRRKDGKYLLYIPVDLAEDSMFPLKQPQQTQRLELRSASKLETTN
jgi:hypothetical protein